MSIYRTIDVDFSITPKNLDVDFSITPKNLDVDASLTTNITHESGSGTKDYNVLIHKPQINSVELYGNRELDELGIGTLSNADLENLLQ